MKIRFISDLHSDLNITHCPTEWIEHFKKKQKADVTLIAGDMSADIDEAQNFLETYFKDEKVIFINGNHCVYNNRKQSLEEILEDHKKRFNGQWKFLENDYVWLNDDIAVIGTIGWTDFLYGHQTKSQYIEEVNKEKAYREKHKDTQDLFDSSKRVPIIYSDNLPDDPAAEYDELQMGNKESYRGRRMKDAVRNMNDYNYGKMWHYGKLVNITPKYIYKLHKKALKAIKKCYNEIITKNPNATIILMTHHPFTKKCESARYKGDPLNAAFISNHDRWLKQFKNIKYIHCGHVHQRSFKRLSNKEIICNPMGYLYYYEDKTQPEFDINKIIKIGE